MVGAVTWKIQFTEISITTMRNHSWTVRPPPTPSPPRQHFPRSLQGGVGLSKYRVPSEGQYKLFLSKRRDKPEKEGGGVFTQKWGVGGSNYEFNHIYCVCREIKVPFITFRILSLLSFIYKRFSSTFSFKSCTRTWYHLYISDPFWQSTKYVGCFIYLSLKYTEQ